MKKCAKIRKARAAQIFEFFASPVRDF